MPAVGYSARVTDARLLRVGLHGSDSASHTRRASSAWHVVVEIDSRRVLVYHAGRVLRRYRAIVGKPSTATAYYFVEENVRLGAEIVGASFALALSARSRVLQEFDGAVTWLAAHLEPGVPVTIR
jgi:hypothetical protein